MNPRNNTSNQSAFFVHRDLSMLYQKYHIAIANTAVPRIPGHRSDLTSRAVGGNSAIDSTSLVLIAIAVPAKTANSHRFARAQTK